MKTARLSLLLVWSFALSVFGAAPVSLLVETNGALRAPVDFFTLNSNLIVAAIGGALGGGSGNASTNQTQAWAAANTQTFLGPVYFGTTNAVTELAGKQNADAQLDTVAALTGGNATNFLAGDGTFKQVTTNMIPGLVADILAAAASGGGGVGEVTLAGTNAFTGPNSFAGTTTLNGTANLNGTTTISNLTVPGTLSASAFSTATPLGFASGGHGATDAAGARSALGVVPGTDVQAQDPILQDLATVGWASGDVPYFDGSNLTNLATTAAGRTLLTAANAAAQWGVLAYDALQSGAYNAGTWDGVTNKAITPDQIVDIVSGLPGGSNSIVAVNTNYFSMAGGYLDWVGGTVGGGGGAGFTYIATNSIGAYTSRAYSTNWPIMSATIAATNNPTATGRFVEGAFGGFLVNTSGTLATMQFNALVNGVLVIRDEVSVSTGTRRSLVSSIQLIRESSTTASLVFQGNHPPIATSTMVGLLGIDSTPGACTGFATNVAVNWSTNITLEVKWTCDTATATNAALGFTPFFSYLRRDADTTSSGTGDVVGPASSTTNNIAVYADATGKLIADGGVTVASLATEAEVAAGYEPLNANKYQATNGPLTTLATGDGSALTNLNASNLASGTVSSNRLPSAIALTTIDAGTITATSVTGDGSGLTNLNGSNISSGTVADARIPTTIARTNAPTLHSPALLGDPTAPTASANDNDTSIATTAYVQAEETALKAANLWQATNSALTSLSAGTSAGLASALSDETGTGVATFATAPTFTGATLNGNVVFGQSTLAAHAAVTNFVADPAISPYQTINADLTTAFTGVRFLHATNVAAGRQTTVLVFAGTNASVNVFLNPQFARNTNSVTVTTGQILPISFYGYGPDNTNVVATMGTPYIR